MQKNKGNIVVWVILVLVVVGGLVYLTINSKKSLPVETENASEEVTNNENTTVDNTNETTEKKEEAKPAQTAKTGDTVAMSYTGRLTNGTVFDSNVDPKFNHVEPFVFTLGEGRVIKGWDEGIVGMKVGEKKTFTIAPEKGYGATAHGPIPANSTLIFDVELLAIKGE